MKNVFLLSKFRVFKILNLVKFKTSPLVRCLKRRFDFKKELYFNLCSTHKFN